MRLAPSVWHGEGKARMFPDLNQTEKPRINHNMKAFAKIPTKPTHGANAISTAKVQTIAVESKES